MSAFLMVMALQVASGPIPCDSALLVQPVRTPASMPPVIADRVGAAEAIEGEARSVGGVANGTSAMIWFLIDVEGHVAVAQVARSSGYEAADSAALRAARTFRFRPARHNDQSVCVWVQLPVRFSGGGQDDR
jgi:periplasmic protein TonB